MVKITNMRIELDTDAGEPVFKWTETSDHDDGSHFVSEFYMALPCCNDLPDSAGATLDAWFDKAIRTSRLIHKR